MPIFATAGAKLYIGAAIASKGSDFIASDFTSQTWTEIKKLESIGTFGDATEEVAFDTLESRRTERVKGQRSAGSLEVVCAIDYADAGQLAAIAAERTDDNYAVRIVFNDAPTGGTPSERMFIAMVGGATEQLDTANSIMRLNLSLWINSNIVRVNAAEA